jgi:cephalosporin-C deacetylase-like acetyl esterase
MNPRTICVLLLSVVSVRADENLASKLKALDSQAVPPEARRQLDEMLSRHIRSQNHEAHRKQAAEWEKVRTLADWERYRDVRITALRQSLGTLPVPGRDVIVHVTQKLDGDGYRIEKLVFEGRPGLPITANLYLPEKLPKKMPALLMLHSFFHGKHQPELQDIGVNGARAGCVVLVPDLLGHGERRQHPFVESKSYPERFNVPRQDYLMRSLLGIQLDIVGESLMGWMVADVMRCIDLLLKRPEIDREKIIALGAVAAGGDIAAVAATLDPRITCVVPSNFGGPEPETPYPLPPEGELSFPYASGGHWDSTRRLRNSARDGFLPWVVVGSVAPRATIYAHEFAWDRDHDPAWKRLTRIYELHNAAPRLGAAFGKGTLFGKPEGTGCGNIGSYHRRTLAPFLREQFGITWPEKEVQQRLTEAELRCMTAAISKEMKPRPVHELAAAIGDERRDRAKAEFASKPSRERTELLWRKWATVLGEVPPPSKSKPRHHTTMKQGKITIERVVLESEPGILVPLLLLRPEAGKGSQAVVIAVSQQGKQGFLANRAGDIAALLEAGVAVCLPDVRGTGETRPAGDRRGRPAGSLVEMQRTSEASLIANEVQMLGQTMLGKQLHDLRSVMEYVASRQEIDRKRILLWGDSFSEVNKDTDTVIVPFDAPKYPTQAEPLGGLLAILGALTGPDVRAVHVGGSLVSVRALLRSRWLHVPADCVVPRMLETGDLALAAATLAPRSFRASGIVSGVNQRVTKEELEQEWKPALESYRTARAESRLTLEPAPAGDESISAWFLEVLREK